MTKLNNSVELLGFIKEAAKRSGNWIIEGHTLAVRLAFGARREDDVNFTSPSDFHKSLSGGDDDECSILLYLQQKKDDAREKFVGKKASMSVKQDALDIDTYLSRLYNEEESPLYHGFLHEMMTSIKDSILFLNGKFDLDTFPPTAETTKMIKAFANDNSNESLNGLVAKRDYFHPYNQNSRSPPKKNQWKRTEEGREYFKKNSDTTAINSSTVSLPSVLGTNAVQPTIAIPTARVGIAVVDTGVRITRFKYSDGTNVNEDENFISTSEKLKDLVKKAKCWPNYDRKLEERFFEVKNSIGELFTTLDKADLSTFTIHDIVSMMNIQSGEFHIIGCTRSMKMESVDAEDDISM